MHKRWSIHVQYIACMFMDLTKIPSVYLYMFSIYTCVHGHEGTAMLITDLLADAVTCTLYM